MTAFQPGERVRNVYAGWAGTVAEVKGEFVVVAQDDGPTFTGWLTAFEPVVTAPEVTVAALVARGVALLDERVPGWHQRINLAGLDIGCCTRCVLGQLFADDAGDAAYSWGLYELGLVAGSAHGFDDDGGYDYDYDDLTAEWWRVIRARQAAKADAP